MKQFENEFTYRKFVESGKEAEFDALFEEAVKNAKEHIFGKTHPMYIGGKEILSDQKFTEKSPIDGTIIGYFQKGNREHARLAIKEAKAAAQAWKLKPYKERAALFKKAADLFSKNKFMLSAILSYENGKSF